MRHRRVGLLIRVPLACVLAGLVVLIGPTGCTDAPPLISASEATRQGILLLGNGTEPQGLDPHLVSGVPENNILSALFEGLIGRDASGQPAPAVARSWMLHEGGLRYRFALDPAARWSNGDPVTAEDFVYSWQRLLNPKLGSPYADMLYYIAGAEAYHQGETTQFASVGVRAEGPHRLVVQLRAPTPFFLQVLQHFSTWPVHPPTIERHGGPTNPEGTWARPGLMVSNGPFVLTEWTLNQRIRVVRSGNYRAADAVRLREIHFYPIEDPVNEERMFRSGLLHRTASLLPQKLPFYRDHNPTALRVDPYLGTYFYRFNTRLKPLDDSRVRRALSLAVNRQEIVDNITLLGQQPAQSFTPPGLGYDPGTRLPYDPERARHTLAEAGYPGGQGFPELELLYNNSEQHSRIAQAVQQMWKRELGIDIRLLSQEWKVYLTREAAGDYQVSRAGWIGDYLDPNTFLDLLVTGRGNNRTGWSHAEYDALLARAARTADWPQRLRLFARAEQLLMREMPVMPMYYYVRASLMHPDVRGWVRHPLGSPDYTRIFLQVSRVGR